MLDFGDPQVNSVELTDAMIATLLREVVNARIRTRALIELLEAKGLLGDGEFDAKAQEVWERDYDQLISVLADQATNGG